MNELVINKGKLYIFPTLVSEETHTQVLPINFISIIKNINYFLVEDIRTARRFLASLKADINIDNLNFIVLNKDTKSSELDDYIIKIKSGVDFGLLSESGCPGIADPGSLAVRLAHDNQVKVTPIVGPCSIILSLMASGFNGQNFEFHGYLPIEKNERIKKILLLENESKKSKKTQIFIETPFRNDHLANDIITNCNNETHFCVCKDITGKNEWIKSIKIKEWKKLSFELGKTPTVFLIFVS